MRAFLLALFLAWPAWAGYNDRAIVSGTVTGHIISAGITPTSVTSCGTGSPTVAGNDSNGVITIGGGTVTACTLNFKATWAAAPVCTANATNATAVGITTVSTTLVTFAIAASGSAKLYYHCVQ